MTTLAIETRRTRAWWKELWVQVLIAMAAGIALGIFHPDLAEKMQPFGDAFIKAIRMLIAPIIFCTVVHGIAHMADMARVGRVALKAIVYFEVITTIALVIALIMVNLLKPGAGMNIDPTTINASVIQALCQADRGGRVRAVPDEHHSRHLHRRVCRRQYPAGAVHFRGVRLCADPAGRAGEAAGRHHRRRRQDDLCALLPS